MAQGTPNGTGLGFFDEEGFDLDEEEQPEVTEEQPEAPEPEADASDQPEETPQGQEAPPVEDGTTEEAPEGEAPPTLYAEKFQSVQELEKAYQEMQSWETRNAQRNAELERQVVEQTELLNTLVPLVNAWRAEQDPEFAEQLAQMEQIQPLVESQVAPIRQQMEAERAQMQLLQVVTQFRSAHPDVEPNSPADFALRESLDALGVNPNQYEPQILETAYEMTQDPALGVVLKANHEWAFTPEGMTLARHQAKQLAAATAPPAATPPATPPPAAPAGPAPFVETGGTGAPASAPSSEDGDEFDAVLASWKKERSSPLFS